MDRFRFKTLDKHKIAGNDEKITIALPFPKSPKGLVYRHCPNEACSPRLFLLGEPPEVSAITPECRALIRRASNTDGTTCPYCGTDAPDDEFVFAGDIEAAKEHVQWAAMQDISDFLGSALEDAARDINRSGGQFIRATFTKGSPEPEPFVWREDLLRNLECDVCQRQYGVFAVGLFCPDCGCRNLSVHFQREVELVSKQVTLAQATSDEELRYRLLGNAHEDVLTALETYLKIVFKFLVSQRMPERLSELCSKKAVGNAFQNVDRARKAFGEFGIDPYSALSDDDIVFLRRNIEKRHVVGHNLGLADEGYLRGEKSEAPGRTVQILAEDIHRFAALGAQAIRELERLREFAGPKS